MAFNTSEFLGVLKTVNFTYIFKICFLQYFAGVGWVTGRACGLSKNLLLQSKSSGLMTWSSLTVISVKVGQ